MRPQDKSRERFAEALRWIPGGVNSPVRAFKAVGGSPIFVVSGSGSRVTDVDGNEYTDFVGSWGPLIHGHCHPEVMQAVRDTLARGTSFGVPTPDEGQLARTLIETYQSMRKVRLVNSGTEATMSAIRLARACTGRDLVIKFDGCYHGHVDGLLVQAGSGVATLGLPDSPGVPAAYASLTVSVPYNDLRALDDAFAHHAGRVACVIVEPIAGNMGVVPPRADFLGGLLETSRRHGALVIFDEVMTGGRVAPGGAQQLYDLVPDLTCLGKIIGGGLPIGAFGGREKIMDQLAPSGTVYQAGTLSGNPLAVNAGSASLRLLRRPGVYDQLEQATARLCDGLAAAARSAGVPVTINRVGSMFTLFFSDSPVFDYASARAANTQRYARFFQEMLSRGVLLPPSQFEAAFVSLAHGDADLRHTLQAATDSFSAL